MLKSNVKWPPSRRFKSRTEWEPIGFFSEALCNSTEFDLKLGFFSSSAINVLSYGFAAFLYAGGRMRMVINDILSASDKHVITVGESSLDIPFFDIHDIGAISNTLSKRDKHFFECLAWLIRNNRIEIKVVRPIDGIGIAHSKCGMFSDGINRVAFDGSCNFSKTALIDNIESITAFCDWDGEGDKYKIQDIADDFERTFNGEDSTVEYVDVSDVKTGLVSVFPDKNIQELLKDESEILEDTIDNFQLSNRIRYYISRTKNKVSKIIENIENKENSNTINVSDVEPEFPFKEPRPYQREAFEKWKNNNQKGLFAMATGTGKTLTSLNCLLEIYKHSHYYKAIILVPTITLVDQWKDECLRFHFRNIVKVCSTNRNWRNEVDELRTQECFATKDNEPSYIIITTYASFIRDNVFSSLTSLGKRVNRQLLLIADEAHNMGSKRILCKLGAIRYLRRIGLSATPYRQYDEEGNKNIMEFFGCQRDEYTFEYSMKAAIENGFLCRYKYFPHLVKLSDEEMSEYMEISAKLAKFFNAKSEKFQDKDSILTALLLKRKRIIHKAVNKLGVFEEIINQRYKEKGDLKYTLVYVPEGLKPDDESSDLFDITDKIPEDDFSDHLIDDYTKVVMNVSRTTTVKKFTSGMKDRNYILDKFAKGEIEVLTSMKCLDEGVDVPRSEVAIFCASTGNPRQFIQRRGRILRTHPDKHMAIIHDLVVAPIVDYSEENYTMERNMLKQELKRVQDFATLSENADVTYSALEDIMNYYNLSIFGND